MRWFLICMFIVLHSLILQGGESTDVRSISFRGNTVVNKKQILQVMRLQPNTRLSFPQLSKDIESIVNYYRHRGFCFVDVAVDSLSYTADSSQVDISIFISEGRAVEIGKILCTGNSIFSNEEILEEFETRKGGMLLPEILETDLYRLIHRYEQTGYPFAEVRVSNISMVDSNDTSRLLVQLEINEGNKVIIDDMRIAGNISTKKNVIVRETRIRLREPYNEAEVQKIPDRLNRLGIFSKVDEPKLYTTSTGGGLLIEVEEGNANTFDGILGYAPAKTDDERGIVTGMVDISMRNLFGTSRKLRVKWLQDERNAQEVGVQYVEPWLFNFPLNLSGSFHQRKQDTIYVKRNIDVQGDLLLTESITIGGSFHQENVIPSGTTKILAQSRTTSTGLEIRYDTRNDRLSPTGGVYYNSKYEVGRKRGSDRNSTVQRVGFDAELFIGTFQRQVAVISMHGRSLSSSKIDLPELYRFGGTNTLRGYRENQFRGSRVAWMNTEYRFLLTRRSFFMGFLDSGYYYLPADEVAGTVSKQSTRFGYGIGIRLETSLGNLGVTVAFGEGDSFLQGKIHLGLINEF